MRVHCAGTTALAFLTVMSLAAPASADPYCDNVIRAGGNTARGPALLWQDGAVWRPLSPARQEKVTAGSRRFVYLVGNAGPGAIVAKRADRREPDDNGSSGVRIIRGRFNACAGLIGLTISKLFGGGDFAGFGRTVALSDYVHFHMQPIDQPLILSAYHQYYVDARNKCTRTDDIDNGNREQFLFEDRFVDGAIVLRNYRLFLDSAVADPAIPHGRIGAALMKYRNYSRLETQLVQYEAGRPACVSFVLSGDAGRKTSLWLNDLDERIGGNARRERELLWKFTWIDKR